MKKIITLLSFFLVLSLLLCGCKDNKEILDNEENESLIELDEDDIDKKWHKEVHYHANIEAHGNCDKCGEYKFNIVVKIDTFITSDAGPEKYKDEEINSVIDNLIDLA